MNMTETQQSSCVPISLTTRVATGSAQWLLEKKEDEKNPVFNDNNLEVYVCGEKAFEEIAKDIENAKESIDIVCWGFDPAMELKRTGDQWPRGATFGQLLRKASDRGVQVRLLVWYSPIGNLEVDNIPDHKAMAFTPEEWMVMMHYAGDNPMPKDASPQMKRRMATAAWYFGLRTRYLKNVSWRTRGGVHQDVVNSLSQEAGARNLSVEALGIELFATHHQKTILIDYEGEKPCGYVMGLNSVTDYWDTQDHKFHDPRRGESWEGANDAQPGLKPYQDYACRIRGEVLAAVCKNFTEGWNKAKANTPWAGENVNYKCDLKKVPENLIKGLTYPRQRAQILRTLPSTEGSEKSIQRLYSQASSSARHYIYIENQYFQHANWVKELKKLRAEYINGHKAAQQSMADVPTLHVIVVTPSPEKTQMVPRTHDAVTELGHGDSMPNQERKLKGEIAYYEIIQPEDTTNYETLQRIYQTVDPMINPLPPSLSAIAQSYKDAGGDKAAETVRKELQDQYSMRSLVASLWACDSEWSENKYPVFAKAQDEQARYEQALQIFKQSQEQGSAADSMPPRKPRSHKKEINKAHKQRYREIYIHSKLMIVDDGMFTLGSANLNLRSFAADSEINIASDDPGKARDLRERVWDLHTEGIECKDPMDRKAMKKTFDRWEEQAKKNLAAKKRGDPLTSFLVEFNDERTSSYRLG